MLVAAGRALIEVPAERGSPALLDVAEDAPLPRAERGRRFETVSVGTDDVREVEALLGCPRGSHASAPLREEVERARRLTDPLLCHVCVTSGRLDVRVPEELSDDVELEAFIE